jgi:hypothetical protein
MPLDSQAARVKVVDPIASTGPSAPARVLKIGPKFIELEVRGELLKGSTIHVRTKDLIAFCKVEHCEYMGPCFVAKLTLIETF